MANPATYPAEATDNGLVIASCQFTAGGTGAVASVQRSREFLPSAPVTRSNTGLYVFAFKEAWPHLAGMVLTNVQATWAAAGACAADITVNAIATTGLVTVQVKKGSDGTAVDPASGDVLKFVFFLQKIKPSATV